MRLANHGGAPVAVQSDSMAPIGDPTDRAPVRFIEVITRWHDDPGSLTLGPPQPVGSARFGPPVPTPGKILGAPVNYVDHQREMRVEHTIRGLGFFLKSPSSVVGMDGEVPLPFPHRRTDQEAELGVVIGRRAADVAADDALDHVFGYTCLIDVTVRGDEERSTRKSFPGFTPIGPWITTADELPDPGDLRIRGWVNDELRQDASTSAMICSVPELIELMSSVATLEPGDIIATGTPAGVGPIEPGDVITVTIDGVGTLRVGVTAGTRAPHPMWLDHGRTSGR